MLWVQCQDRKGKRDIFLEMVSDGVWVTPLPPLSFTVASSHSAEWWKGSNEAQIAKKNMWEEEDFTDAGKNSIFKHRISKAIHTEQQREDAQERE